ncbi:MAG: GIY-YIG nuclease family protein [bacterium]|nr:GIY-YIG nuclease family protein [bacterium]
MKKQYQFYVYIISNYLRTVFYTGFTNDIVRRIIEHKFGLYNGFSKKYQLKILLYYEEYQYANQAIDREKEIKKWRREKKINLIKTTNFNMEDLSLKLFKDYNISQEEIVEYIREIKKEVG